MSKATGKIRTLIMALAYLAIICMPDVASACPTCKNALHSNGTAMGFAISIVFMMLMPFAIFTFWAVTIIRLRRSMLENSDDQALELPQPSLPSTTG